MPQIIIACYKAQVFQPQNPVNIKASERMGKLHDAFKASGGKKAYKSDAERVAFLFDLYQRMTSLLPADAGKVKRRVKSVA